MHQSCFSFDHYVITRSLGIGTTLSIACGGWKVQKRGVECGRRYYLQTCDGCIDETWIDCSAVIPT